MKPMVISPMLSTAVGRRGTRPVARNSRRMGTIRTTASRQKPRPMRLKKAIGRSSLMNTRIFHRMRNPSRYVDSLLVEPLGRSR